MRARLGIAVTLTLLVVALGGCLNRDGAIDANTACAVARDLRSGAAALRDALTAVDEDRVDDAVTLGSAARELGASAHEELLLLREDGMREHDLTTWDSAALILDQMGFFFAEGPDSSNRSLDAARQATDEATRIASAMPEVLRADYAVDCDEDP